jgi:hypothetical protein
VTRELEVLGVCDQRERQAGLRVEVDDQHRVPSSPAQHDEATDVVLATPPFWWRIARVTVRDLVIASIMPDRLARS